MGDLTTGATGTTVAVEDRLSEILHRYAIDDPVSKFVAIARPALVRAGQSPLALTTDKSIYLSPTGRQ